jgi:hypothetical protein
MGALSSVYERTGLCPHTNACDSFSAIVNSESWMEKTLSGLRRSGTDAVSWEEGGYTADGLQERLLHMRRVKERCYSGNRRCLRFWQLERRARRLEDKFGWRSSASTGERLLDSFSVSAVSQESS